MVSIVGGKGEGFFVSGWLFRLEPLVGASSSGFRFGLPADVSG